MAERTVVYLYLVQNSSLKTHSVLEKISLYLNLCMCNLCVSNPNQKDYKILTKYIPLQDTILKFCLSRHMNLNPVQCIGGSMRLLCYNCNILSYCSRYFCIFCTACKMHLAIFGFFMLAYCRRCGLL